MAKAPAALEPGDGVAVVAPAAAIDRPSLEQGVHVLVALGYRVRVAPDVYRQNAYLAGSDQVRAESLRAALADPEVRAVFLARGGYGSARLLPLLDGRIDPEAPKIVVGYSDTTAILAWLTGRLGWITFHGPMVAADFPSLSAAERRGLRDLLAGRGRPAYRLGAPIHGGVTEGRLLGGNLATLVSLLGTPWAPSCDGAILFLEDRNEKPYRIDRMLTQLRLSGLLAGLKGLVFGEMPECGGTRELRRIVRELTEGLNLPVATGLRSGHGRGKRTLPLGARARLDADQRALEILEPVVV